MMWDVMGEEFGDQFVLWPNLYSFVEATLLLEAVSCLWNGQKGDSVNFISFKD